MVKKVYKLIFLSVLILFCLIVISSVSAADTNDTSLSDVSSVSDVNGSISDVNLKTSSSDNLKTSSNVYYISPNGNGDGSSSNTPTSWSNAYWNLNNGGTVYFTSGTYTNIVNQPIGKNITLSSYNGADVFLNAGNNGCLFYCTDSSCTLTLNGLTFMNGKGYSDSSNTYNQLYGGAIFSLGSVNINNCKFMSNNAVSGGAVYGNNVIVTESSFTSNRASYTSAAIYAKNYCSLTNSSFTANTVTVQEAGAVRSVGDCVITNCNFTANNAPYLAGAVMAKNAVITGSNFMGNYLTATDSPGSAGAVYTEKTCDVTDSSFTGNRAGYGGALQVAGKANVKNSIFIGNTATIYGGAINGRNSTVSGSVFLYNSAPKGNAICYTIDVSADYNWWGENKPFDSETNNLIYYFTWDKSGNDIGYNVKPNNWVILTGSLSSNTIKSGQSTVLTIGLNSYNTISGSTGTLPSTVSLPWRNVIYTCSNGNLNSTSQSIKTIVTNTYTADNTIGLSNITVMVDKQSLKIPVTITEPDQPVPTSITNTELVGYENGTVTINVVSDNGIVNSGSVNLFYNNSAISTSYLRNGEASLSLNGLQPGNYSVIAFYFGKNGYADDSKALNLTVKSIVNVNKTELTVYNFTEKYGTHNNFTGKLIDSAGNPIIGQHVALNLTRLSNGASKVYWVTTDTNGEFLQEINLSPGNYTGSATYSGNKNYQASNSGIANIIVTRNTLVNTTISVNSFNHPYGSGNNLTGKLINAETGEPLVGQHIALNLTRYSNKASKVYWVTTDILGEYQLAINLTPGGYMVSSSYAGTNEYNSSSVRSTFTVSQN